MSALQPFDVPESPAGDDRPETDALTAAIGKALEALDAAAEEAAKGRLGAAKLGLLVAASRLLDALKAADAEFERRYANGPALSDSVTLGVEGPAARPEREVSRHAADTHAV